MVKSMSSAAACAPYCRQANGLLSSRHTLIPTISESERAFFFHTLILEIYFLPLLVMNLKIVE